MKKFFKGLSVLTLVAVIGASIYSVTHTRQIMDWYALLDYEAPAAIASLADDTTMNDETRNVFYVNHPELQNKQQFQSSCIKQEETIVLGCYVENTGIFLLEVDDERLDGITEVTAAHEVLHAMYDRLDDDERAKVDKMTANFFKTLNNKRIKENVENYRKRDASVVPNELHSILATEVRELNNELEEYYKRYFDDRLAIVKLSEAYEQTFIDLENQVKNYQKQLDNLKIKLDGNDSSISNLGNRIDSERSRLDRLLNSDQVEEYNQSVNGFNNLVGQYNGLIQERKSIISQYNRIVGLYNEVASTEAELVDSLKIDTQEIQPALN